MRRPAPLVLLAAVLAAGCGERPDPDAGTTTGTGPATSRSAAIVVDKSIGAVGIGMTAGDVRAALGEPDARRPSELHGGWERWTYERQRIAVTLDERGTVWDVRTRSARYRSRDALRVLLPKRAVEQRLPRARCRPYGGPPRYRTWTVCTSGRPQDGPFTRVLLIGGVAREISVARALAR